MNSMSRSIIVLVAGVTVATGAAVAQESCPEHRGVRLEGTIDQYDFSTPPAAAPVPDEGQPDFTDTPVSDERIPDSSGTTRRQRLNRLARGVGRAIYQAGYVSGVAAVGLIEGMAAASAYAPYQGTGPFVPTSTYGGDSCVHGYSMPRCPYNSTAGSYGSMYLSGRANVRTRPDRLGGYRYYNTNGEYGSARPLYTGGYRVTTASGTSYRTTVVSPWNSSGRGHATPYSRW